LHNSLERPETYKIILFRLLGVVVEGSPMGKEIGNFLQRKK